VSYHFPDFLPACKVLDRLRLIVLKVREVIACMAGPHEIGQNKELKECDDSSGPPRRCF
jgi:hypothetical protein